MAGSLTLRPLTTQRNGSTVEVTYNRHFFLCHIKVNVLYLQNVLYGHYGQCTKYVLCSSTTQY
jgi:hypothetical protein